MAFGFYRSLTIDHTKCGSSDSSNFPVLVSISGSNSVKTVANGGHIQHTGTQSGGSAITIPFDLVFSSDNTGVSKYAWEVEAYDAATGLLVAWVLVPTVSHTTNTVLYMVYGDASVSTQQNVSSFSVATVWAAYKGVWHFQDLVDASGTSGPITNHGTHTSTTGKIGPVASHSAGGSADYYTASDGALPTGANPISFSMWIKPDASTGTVLEGYLSYGTGGNDTIFVMGKDTTNVVEIFTFNVAGFYSGSYATGVWHYVVGTYDGTNLRMYVDGVVGTTSANKTMSIAHQGTFQIGGWPAGVSWNSQQAFEETHVLAGALSQDWITTEYNNQNAPGNIGSADFITFGPENGGGGGSVFGNALYGGINPLQGFFS